MQQWLLVVTLAGALVVFGGWYPWTTGPIFLATLAVALSNRRNTFQFPPSFRVLDLALVALVAAIALQAVPLPPPLVSLLNPHAARVRGTLRLDAPLGGDDWLSLSVDPRATFDAMLIVAAAVLMFWSARAAFAAGGLRRFCRVMALLGLLLSLEAFVQRIATPDRIYGFWPPYTPAAHPFGPFFNRNHFAAWLIMAIPLITGYLAARVRTRIGDARERRQILEIVTRAGMPLLMVLSIMMLVLTMALSRSAILGLAAAAVAARIMARDRMEMPPGRTGPALVVVTLVGMFVVTAVDADQWFQRVNAAFSQTTTSRLTIWRETLPIVRDFALTGPGAGTYSMVMLLYQKTVVAMPHLRDTAHFNQAHSHYVQLAAEGGLLLLLPAAVAFIAFARSAREALAQDRGEAMWMRVGAAAGLVAIATQSIWETALRLPANALLCAVLAGIAVHRRRADPRSAR